MHVINAINVRDALPEAAYYLSEHGYQTQTRIGNAITSLCPVTINYANPKEHVLLNHTRDANPFFHLLEAMWMLAGRDDGGFLDHYIKGFSEKFGTNGRIMDAYGYRWRHGLGYDQLHEIVKLLKQSPNTRQAVLEMWGAGRNDLIEPDPKPCNIAVSFQTVDNRLNMTVFNRSNDLILGCCGANAVHFPILQEYIAGMVGLQMGRYWQISTNLHIYNEQADALLKRVNRWGTIPLHVALDDGVVRYEGTEPLITYPEEFDTELEETMEWVEGIQKNEEAYTGNISNPFLSDVVIPMAQAHQMYKNKDWDRALESINNVIAADWQRAGKEWILRRVSR